MKTHTIEWKHLDRDGRTCQRCDQTGANLRRVIRELNVSCRPSGMQFRLKDTRLKPERLAESNSIFIDRRPLETFLPESRVTSTECASCGELTGESAQCRAISNDRGIHESIPAEIIREALCKAVACCERPPQTAQ